MNKQNKILLGILTFVVACTMGYALFSESITISGTASAIGNFEITTTCETGIGADFISAGYVTSSNDGQGGYKNDSCTVAGNNVQFNVEFEYPTAKRYYTVKMKNTGDIAMQYDMNNLGIYTELIVDEYNYTTNELIEHQLLTPNDVEEGLFDRLVGLYEFGVSDIIIINENNVPVVEEEEIMQFITDDGMTIVLKPDQAVAFTFISGWPEHMSPRDSYYVYSAKTSFVWNQVTN